MKAFELISLAENKLVAAGIDTARLDAEILLAHVLKRSRFDVLLDSRNDVAENLESEFNELISRRELREPVAYIVGKNGFWSLDVKVTKDVLVPRPETELVVEEALKFARNIHGQISILDLCTGSGCIAMAIAHELAFAKITVTDRSARALAVARENLFFASDRTSFFEGDLFDALPKRNIFDIITANPPYIPHSDKHSLAPDITMHEPEMALYAEKDGLALIEKIIKTVPQFLMKSGALIIEFGIHQSASICEFAKQAGFEIIIVKDLSGIDRVAVMTN